jgi:hypothetical protein
MVIISKSDQSERAAQAIKALIGKIAPDGRKITKYVIAEYFNTKAPRISEIPNKRAIHLDELQILKEVFKVNPEFLEGKSDIIFSDENMAFEPQGSYAKPTKIKGIPYYEINVTAGDVTLFQDFLSKMTPSFYFDIPILGKCDFALPVSGLSMMNKYAPGDIVFYKTIHDWQNYLEYGSDYLIVTESRNLLKYIRKSSKSDHFLLCSWNEKEGFDPFDIKLSDIRSIHIVAGKVEKKII